MPTTKNKLVAAAVAVVLLFGTWSLMRSDSDDSSNAAGAELLANHVWIERMPRTERDMIRYLVPLQHPDGSVGVAGKGSQWRLRNDVFLWSLKGDRLSMYFGQDEVRWRPHVRTWRCEGEAPEGFELCLKIWDKKHATVLYSRDDWEIDPDNVAQTAAVLTERAPAIGAIVNSTLDRAMPAMPAMPEDLESYATAHELPFLH